MMFVVRGPVSPDSPLHVERHAALDQVSGWLVESGCVIAILGARQTGKTSFCHWLRARLNDRYAFTYVDFQGFDGSTWTECARYIADKLLHLCPEADDLELPNRGAALPRFLRDLALRVPAVRIVVVFEELGALSADCRKQLGQKIRAMFTEKSLEPAYERYAFVIAGAYEIHDLAGTRSSPLWNVAEKLYLEDFSAEQVAGLVRAGITASDDSAERLAGFIYRWTSGHPYWTQRLAQELAQAHMKRDPEFEDIDSAEEAVRRLVQTEETNLSHFFELLDGERKTLLPFIDKILSEELQFSRFDKRIAILELIGAIANRAGQCVVRNRIYQHAMAQRQFDGVPVGAAPTESATLVNVDMVGYSTLARYVDLVLGAEGVGLLGKAIQTEIRAGLAACGLDDAAIHGFTGDGAILRFAEARQAHEFAGHFMAAVHARNRTIPRRALRRHYRMGAATGDIASWGENDTSERAGLVFTRARRLESAGAHGDFLIDIDTFAALPAELAALYDDREEIVDKHGTRFAAHRWTVPAPTDREP